MPWGKNMPAILEERIFFQYDFQLTGSLRMKGRGAGDEDWEIEWPGPKKAGPYKSS